MHANVADIANVFVNLKLAQNVHKTFESRIYRQYSRKKNLKYCMGEKIVAHPFVINFGHLVNLTVYF